jgi:uncharacterized protein YbjT (DUF2867 family)
MQVLAVGATGRFAHLVVPALVRHGLEVRALVRDPGKAAAATEAGATQIVHADLADRSSLDAAVDGVDGVFLITPAFHPRATEFGVTMIEAAMAAGVGKIVYNGVYHPSLPLENHADTRPIETALYAADIDFTIFQPAMYLQSIDAIFPRALQTGELAMPWSKHSAMTFVDYRDVAEAAALAFVDPRLSYGTFELAAGGMIDRVELAALISRATGRTVVATDNPAPADAPPAMAAMFDTYDREGFHGGNSLVLQTILCREPRSVTSYISELTQRYPAVPQD